LQVAPREEQARLGVTEHQVEDVGLVAVAAAVRPVATAAMEAMREAPAPAEVAEGPPRMMLAIPEKAATVVLATF
jgi:hypothetical protein